MGEKRNLICFIMYIYLEIVEEGKSKLQNIFFSYAFFTGGGDEYDIIFGLKYFIARLTYFFETVHLVEL